MCVIDDVGGWQYEEVKAINRFHDRYVDKDEEISIDRHCFINVRGTGSYAGAVVVTLYSGYTSKNITIEGLNDGTYVDLISKNEFELEGGKVTVEFTHGACVLIPKDAYVPDEGE